MHKILSTAPLAIHSPNADSFAVSSVSDILAEVLSLEGTTEATVAAQPELNAWLDDDKAKLDEDPDRGVDMVEGLNLASSSDVPTWNAVDTHAQIATAPPETGGNSGAGGGWVFPPWAWTIVGVAFIAAIDAYDRNSEDDGDDAAIVNTSPVFAQGIRTVTALRNADTEITAEATDADGDTITYTATDPANGSVIQDSENPGTFIYTPDTGYVGSDSFIFSAADGKGTPGGQIVNITVAEPVASYTLSSNTPSVTEDDVDTVQMTLELTLDQAAFGEDVVVNIVSSGGSAIAGEDYTAIDTQLIFAAGQTTATLTIDVLPDTIFEGDETIEFTISGDRLGAPVTATATINDNDPDTEAPAAATLALDDGSDTGDSADDNITNDVTPTLNISAEAGAEVEVFLGGVSVGLATEASDNAGEYVFTSAELTDGVNSFTASVKDLAGNVSELSLSEDVTIDTSAATLANLTADAAANTVTVQFSESLANVIAADFSFLLNDADVAVVNSELLGEDSIRFTLDADFVTNDSIDVAIAIAAVTDLAGNGYAGIAFADDPAAITA